MGLASNHFRIVRQNNYDGAEKRLREFQQSVWSKREKLSVNELRIFDRKVQAIELTLASGEWMFWPDEQNNFVVFPLSARRQAENLFSMTDKILFMSATIGGVEPFLAGLGFSVDAAASWAADNSVKVERRSVSYQPMGLRSRNSYGRTLPNVVDACKQVLDKAAL